LFECLGGLALWGIGANLVLVRCGFSHVFPTICEDFPKSAFVQYFSPNEKTRYHEGAG
jgi:hypothetical protein